MYLHTVVDANECGMNLKPAYNTAKTLRDSCTRDATAAQSLDTYLEYLKGIEHGSKQPGQPRSPEQMARNDFYLSQIKARLLETLPKRTANTYRKGWSQ